MKRLIKLYCKDYILSTIESVVNSESNTSNYYIEAVEFFSKFDAAFYKDHVEGIFIDAIPGDSISVHYDFCREVAIHYGTFVYFEANDMSFKISNDTPGDWYDMCIDDCYRQQGKDKVFGPDYIDLSVEDAKYGIWVCKRRIETFQDMILETIYPNMNSFGLSWQASFHSYTDYKKWAAHLYEDIFKLQRRLKRYLDVLKETNEQFTEEDLSRFDKRLEADIKNYLNKKNIVEEKI